MPELSARKQKKRELVASFSSKYKIDGNFVFLVDYSGMNAAKNYEFRSAVRGVGGSFAVLRNTLNSIALKQAGFEHLSDLVSGQIAVIFGFDCVGIAKIISGMVDSQAVKFVAYSDGKTLYDLNSLSALAKLPSAEVLRAKLLGLLVSVPTKFVSLLMEPARSLARVLSAKSKTN